MNNKNKNGFANFFLGVLVGIYGNWLILFLERLTFPPELSGQFYILFGLTILSFTTFLCYLLSAFANWLHPNMFWVLHIIITLISFVFQNSFIKSDQQRLVQNMVFLAVGIIVLCLILSTEWVSSGRRHRHTLERRWSKPSIGILNDVEWDITNTNTCTYTDISPEEWKKLFQASSSQSAKLITSEHDFDGYAAILNPYGGVYPEKDLSNLATLNKILDYVNEGGIFINVADIPSYWAYDQQLNRRLDTTSPIYVSQNNQLVPRRLFEQTPLMKELGLRVLNTQVQQDFKRFSKNKIKIISERVAFVEANIESFVPTVKIGNDETSAFFRVKYGKGDFLFSLIFMTQQYPTAKEIIKKALTEVSVVTIKEKAALHQKSVKIVSQPMLRKLNNPIRTMQGLIKDRFILAAVIMILFASGLFIFYYTGLPQGSSRLACGIMVGYTNQHSVDEVIIGIHLTPDEQHVTLDISMVTNHRDNYSIAISLPYRISRYSLDFRDDMEILIEDTDTGSIVLTRLDVLNYTRFSIILEVYETIALSNLGTYSLDVPLGSGFTQEVSEAWRNLPIPVPVGGEVRFYNLYLVIPSKSVDIQSSRPIQARRISEQYQIIEYNLEKAETVFLTYKRADLINLYQISLFIAGLLFGIGFPLLIQRWEKAS